MDLKRSLQKLNKAVELKRKLKLGHRETTDLAQAGRWAPRREGLTHYSDVCFTNYPKCLHLSNKGFSVLPWLSTKAQRQPLERLKQNKIYMNKRGSHLPEAPCSVSLGTSPAPQVRGGPGSARSHTWHQTGGGRRQGALNFGHNILNRQNDLSETPLTGSALSLFLGPFKKWPSG